jgi:hypothetical protein
MATPVKRRQRVPRQVRVGLGWAWLAITLLQLGVFVTDPSALGAVASAVVVVCCVIVLRREPPPHR